jgi:eukaryotic-like serine/threonine-protein kinase
MDAKKIEEGFWENKIIKGAYVIEHLLGDGGMGLVYRAHAYDDDRRIVVVKTLKSEASRNKYLIKKFWEEGVALGRINHDGVVKFIDKGTDEETDLPFLVMEFAAGPTLTNVIEREPMDAKKCVHLVRQIAFALKAAHDQDVLHRDLKPDNVVVVERQGEPDKIKLIDFGIAKVKESNVGRSTSAQMLVGTIEYLSPEQLSFKQQTIQGEVFSLAAVAYQMLTQKLAFPLPGSGDINDKIIKLRELHAKGHKSPLLYRRDLPTSVEAVFNRGLAVDPAKRYKTPVIFAEALAAALENRVNTAPRTVYRRRSKWKAARSRLRPLAIALILLLATGGIYHYACRRGPAKVVPSKTTFRNSRGGLGSSLKSHFIDFSFEHPADWVVRRVGVDDFADVGKFGVDGIPVEQVRIGWYQSKECFRDQKCLEELARRELPRAVPGYESDRVSYEQSKDERGEVVRFHEVGRSGKETVWGQTLFYKNGLRITVIATSLSADVKSESDVTTKGGISLALSSLKFPPDRK